MSLIIFIKYSLFDLILLDKRIEEVEESLKGKIKAIKQILTSGCEVYTIQPEAAVHIWQVAPHLSLIFTAFLIFILFQSSHKIQSITRDKMSLQVHLTDLKTLINEHGNGMHYK